MERRRRVYRYEKEGKRGREQEAAKEDAKKEKTTVRDGGG